MEDPVTINILLSDGTLVTLTPAQAGELQEKLQEVLQARTITYGSTRNSNEEFPAADQ